MDRTLDADDTSEIQSLHQGMVDRLRRSGRIATERVESAFRAVPRHLFLPSVPLDQVYADDAIVTKRQDGIGISSSSQPSMMAIMLDQLDPRPGDRVLEIGAGTGYNAALLAHMVGETGEVVTVDLDEDIVAEARAHLDEAGCGRVRVVCGDGGDGYAEGAPYDRIILTVGAWDIAPAWREQLAPDGRLVLPLSIRGVQRSIAFERAGDCLESVSVHDCWFISLRGAFAGPEERVRLSPDVNVSLWLAEKAGDQAHAAAWLSGGSHHLPAGIRLTQMEAFRRLALWLALHDAGSCMLTADEAACRRYGLVCSSRYGDQCQAIASLTDDGLCLIGFPAGDSPWAGFYDDARAAEPVIQVFGGEAAGHRLRVLLQGWERSGRPGTDGLRVRACPREVEIQPAEGEAVIDKRWSRLVLSWDTR